MMRKSCMIPWLMVFLLSVPSLVHSNDVLKSVRKPGSRIVSGTEASSGAWPLDGCADPFGEFDSDPEKYGRKIGNSPGS